MKFLDILYLIKKKRNFKIFKYYIIIIIILSILNFKRLKLKFDIIRILKRNVMIFNEKVFS